MPPALGSESKTLPQPCPKNLLKPKAGGMNGLGSHKSHTDHAPPAVSRRRRKKPRLLRVDKASTVCPDLPPSSALSPSIRALEHTKHRLPRASDLLSPLGPTCGINMVGETQPA